jgi:hypothetical protein
MLKTGILSIMLIGAGSLAFSAAPASAFTIPVLQHTAADNNLVTEIKHRRGGERHVWNKKRHGARCSRRMGNCRHYYHGHYYANQWWLMAPYIGARIIIGGDQNYRYGSRHVRWCSERYRSYSPRYNTWMSYSGVIRQCVSPYS